jgi:hypothetical protein
MAPGLRPACLTETETETIGDDIFEEGRKEGRKEGKLGKQFSRFKELFFGPVNRTKAVWMFQFFPMFQSKTYRL